LRPNESLSFICRDVELWVERADTPFTALCSQGQSLTIPIKHGEGCWFAGEELLAQLESHGQIILRYEENPNGAVADIASVVNERGNVMGLMPHPEHAVDALVGSTDGALILGSLVAAARERAPAIV
ncbi:MAG TPA: phosphoribosylformylglycinamidine synthase subunit PurQ, partial [Gaiellaceae bacterium]